MQYSDLEKMGLLEDVWCCRVEYVFFSTQPDSLQLCRRPRRMTAILASPTLKDPVV